MEKCRNFQRGSCKFGSRCRYSHEGTGSSSDQVDRWGKTDPDTQTPYKAFGSKDRERDKDKGASGGEYNADDTVRIWCRPNAKSFVNSMQMKRFIKACSDSVQRNSNELLDNICGGDRTGLDRITEISQCDFEVDAGTDFQKYSFQQIIVGMLKLVMDPKLSNSVLRRQVNNIINVIQENLDFEAVEQCLANMEARQSIDDRNMTRYNQDFWSPKSWDDLLLPISAFCEKVIPQTQAKQASPEMLKLISRLKSIAENIDGVGKKFKEQVQYLQNEPSSGINPERQIPPDLAQKLQEVVDVQDKFNDIQPMFFDGFEFACRHVDFLVLKAFKKPTQTERIYFKTFASTFVKTLSRSVSEEYQKLMLGVCDKLTPEYEHKSLVRGWYDTRGAIFQVILKRRGQIDEQKAQQFVLQLMKGVDVEIQGQVVHVGAKISPSREFEICKVIRLQNFGSKHFNADFGEWLHENILKRLPGLEESKLQLVLQCGILVIGIKMRVLQIMNQYI